MKSPSGSSQPREELHGLIEPDRTRSRQLLETAKHVDYILGAQAKHNMELADHQHFGEVGKERSRRTLIYSYDWIIDQGHEHAASVSQDAALLAANCGVPLMLSVNHRDLDPVFEPELIMFNGRDDECDDFTYPPTEDAGFGSNRGRCRTECRTTTPWSAPSCWPPSTTQAAKRSSDPEAPRTAPAGPPPSSSTPAPFRSGNSPGSTTGPSGHERTGNAPNDNPRKQPVRRKQRRTKRRPERQQLDRWTTLPNLCAGERRNPRARATTGARTAGVHEAQPETETGPRQPARRTEGTGQRTSEADNGLTPRDSPSRCGIFPPSSNDRWMYGVT